LGKEREKRKESMKKGKGSGGKTMGNPNWGGRNLMEKSERPE